MPAAVFVHVRQRGEGEKKEGKKKEEKKEEMKGPSRHLARTVVVHDFKVSVEDNSFQATDVNNKYKNIRKGKCCRRNLISCVDSKKKGSAKSRKP